MLFTESNSPFGKEFLDRIQKHPQADLVAVVTRAPGVFSPDYAPSVADVPSAATLLGIPVLKPPLIGESGPLLQDMLAEYFVIANYQLHLPPQILQLPSRFCINFHVGPLPRYAGLTPWHWMWRNQETKGGVAAIRTVDRIDAGEIIDDCLVALDTDLSEKKIRERHFDAAYLLLQRVLDRLPTLSAADFRPQDLRYRTYYNRSGLVEQECGSLAITTASP